MIGTVIYLSVAAILVFLVVKPILRLLLPKAPLPYDKDLIMGVSFILMMALVFIFIAGALSYGVFLI